jgi:hypothetical protein
MVRQLDTSSIRKTIGGPHWTYQVSIDSMATHNPIKTPIAPVELTEAQELAKKVIGDGDLTLARFVSSLSIGYQHLWGTPESPTPRDKAVAALEVNPDEWAALFARHAAVMSFLTTEGLAQDIQPWEVATPYEVTFSEGSVTVGEDLNPAWEV